MTYELTRAPDQLAVAGYVGGFVFPPVYGAAGDGSTDDRAALSAALSAAASAGIPVLIDRPYFVSITSEAHPIRMAAGLRLIFRGAGSIRYSAFGLPLLWAAETSNIQIQDPVIYWSGTAATSLPTTTQNFYDNVLQRTGNSFPPRDVMGAISFFGCDDVRVYNPKIYASNFTDATRLVQRAIVFADHNDGSQAVDNGVYGHTVLDGVTMGILAWGQKRFNLGSGRSVRWSQLDVNTYTWEVACHAFYLTSRNPNTDVVIGDWHDEGIEVPAPSSSTPYYANWPTSFKPVGITGGQCGRLSSKRNAGLLEWGTTNFAFGEQVWTGSTWAAQPLIHSGYKYGNGAAVDATNTTFSTITLNLPSDIGNKTSAVNGLLVVSTAETTSLPNAFTNINFGRVTINYGGSSWSDPLLIGRVSQCTGNFVLNAPSLTASSLRVARIQGGGTGNFFRADVNGPDASTMYVDEIVNDGSIQNIGSYTNYKSGVVTTSGVKPARTNKCNNYNANPTDLTGLTKTGDAAATLTLVDDTASLTTANLGTICTSGKVYKLDNSAGSTAAIATQGTTGSANTGNTNAHSLSAWMRGTGTARLRLTGVNSTTLALSSTYTKWKTENVTPSASTDNWSVWASAGAVVYFILNQLEEGATASPIIITQGSSASRP